MEPSLQSPHLAILPLSDVGWEHASGRLLGIALTWPRDIPDAERRASLRLVARFLAVGGVLRFGRLGIWRVESGVGDSRASLNPARYARSAQRWTTVLPAVLDRHPKSGPGRDLAAILLNACRNLGFSDETIAGLEVEQSRQPFVSGAPSVSDVTASMASDSPYRGRPMSHLMLKFPLPVRGPIIIGAGRYRGLGLCLALDTNG